MDKTKNYVTYNVIGFGDLVIDVMVQVNEFPIITSQSQILQEMSIQPGGMANFLIAGKRLGLNTIPIDVAAADLFGKGLANILESERIDISEIKNVPGISSKIILVLTNGSGEHAFLAKLGGNYPLQTLSEEWKTALFKADAIFSVGYSLLEDYLANAAIEAMEHVKRKGGIVVFDPGPMIMDIPAERILQAVRTSDILLMTADESELLLKQCACHQDIKGLLTLGPSTLCIKLGSDGCKIISNEHEIDCPGFKVKVKDTNGAGDSFAAAFIYGKLNNYPAQEIGLLANAMGAAKVQKFGAGQNVPTKEEIVKILEENGVRLELLS